MNRTDRLLAIVLALQAHGKQRAADLAALFETSPRTIYRDIQALSEAGVPLVAIPGQGYSLMEGYFLPPLTFTADEATMLLLGSEVIAQSFDSHYRSAARMAGQKIAGVLPDRIRTEVAELRENVHFIPESGTPPDSLASLRRAMLDHRTVELLYHTRFRDERQPSEPLRRAVDPYTLVHHSGAWYLTGHDHLRDDLRTFRLDRIESFHITERNFVRPSGVLQHSRPNPATCPIEIRARFDPSIVRWVRENWSIFTTAEEETPDGLLLTFHVRQESELISWLLSWGRNVRVLSPETLRCRIAEEANAMAAAHAPAESPTPG